MSASRHASRSPSALRVGLTACSAIVLFFGAPFLLASDHADPIDLFRLKPLEPVITDLFVFPVNERGEVVHAIQRTDRIPLHEIEVARRKELTTEQRQEIQGLIVILCVRRDLTQSRGLNLAPYTYQIHMDTRASVAFHAAMQSSASDFDMDPDHFLTVKKQERPTSEEAWARYGGALEHPDAIDDNVHVKISLKNDATLNNFEIVKGLSNRYSEHDYVVGQLDPQRISVWTGIRDDPFIFPAFFRSNVVAMVVHLPLSCFPAKQRTWLVWATSHKGRRQIDHVGRSLRTQNPRFELLNALPPGKHVDALKEEHRDPSFMRDLTLRAGFESYFAFREWDFVPDVMIYTNRFPAGFPNGRLLVDDVAALLAQHGDTLLLELSYHEASWPRRTTNDKEFLLEFPYLAAPWPDRAPPEQHQLSWKNWLIVVFLVVIALITILLAIVQLWQIIRRLWGIQPRRNYL